MNSEPVEGRQTLGWMIIAAAGARAAFGIVMAIDAYVKWQRASAAHYAALVSLMQ